jgi:PhnB protein
MRQDNSSPSEAEIRAVIDDRAEAMRRKDATRVISHGAADLVHFSLAPPLVAKDTDAKGLDAWFATWEGPIDYEVCDLRVIAGDEVAFCHSLNRMRGMQNGGTTDLWFRHTAGFRKIGGEWKIVHQHDSVPFRMDGSFRAAVDLKP